MRSFKKRRHAMSGKCGVTSIAGLFVAVWELVLKPCQLAERPIQKKKKKKNSRVSIPKISTHSILPQTHTNTHTHYRPGSQSKKQGWVCLAVCVCAVETVGGRAGDIPLPRAGCPPNSNASAVVGTPHRMAVNILYSKEKINTSSSEPRG